MNDAINTYLSSQTSLLENPIFNTFIIVLVILGGAAGLFWALSHSAVKPLALAMGSVKYLIQMACASLVTHKIAPYLIKNPLTFAVNVTHLNTP